MKEAQGILAEQSRRGNKILKFQGNIRARYLMSAPNAIHQGIRESAQLLWNPVTRPLSMTSKEEKPPV